MSPMHALPIVRRGTASGERSVYFFSLADVERLIRHARAQWPEEVRAIIESAERICSAGVAWHGPCHDREQLFFLHRCSWAPMLAKGYRYTGEARFVRRLIELLKDWEARNPTGDPLTWESYSVAERICNLTCAARLLVGTPGFDEFLDEWLAPRLARHASYLMGHLETALMHNHLINDARALLTYGLTFPDLARAKECAELGWEIVQREMIRQTRPDGIFREQSTHYHLLLTRTCAECILLARANGLAVPREMTALLERMFGAMADMIRPDGTIPYVGDICPDIESRDLVGLLAVGAVLFRRPDFKRPETVNEHALWYLGGEGLTAYLALPEEPPSRWARNYPDGGIVSLGYRGLMGNAHVIVRADPVGQVMFHGDMDPLGIDVWIDGRSVIRDSGNYTYVRDEWWEYFKDAAAQNTIVVDDLPPWPEASCARWFPAAYCAVTAGTTVDDAEGERPTAEAWHTGYRRLPQPLTLRRRVTLHPPKGVMIVDTLEGAGTHAASVYFHLGPGRATRVGERVRLVSDEGETTAWIRPRSERSLRIDLVEGWAASRYGAKEPTAVMRVTVITDGPARVETAVSRDPGWLDRVILCPDERLTSI